MGRSSLKWGSSLINTFTHVGNDILLLVESSLIRESVPVTFEVRVAARW